MTMRRDGLGELLRQQLQSEQARSWFRRLHGSRTWRKVWPQIARTSPPHFRLMKGSNVLAADEGDQAERGRFANYGARGSDGAPDQFSREPGALVAEDAAHPGPGPCVLDVLRDGGGDAPHGLAVAGRSCVEDAAASGRHELRRADLLAAVVPVGQCSSAGVGAVRKLTTAYRAAGLRSAYPSARSSAEPAERAGSWDAKISRRRGSETPPPASYTAGGGA
jgi:hypothetical protein